MSRLTPGLATKLRTETPGHTTRAGAAACHRRRVRAAAAAHGRDQRSLARRRSAAALRRSGPGCVGANHACRPWFPTDTPFSTPRGAPMILSLSVGVTELVVTSLIM
jgi:hypothetical protein